jgi:hypothetical protein
LIGNVYETSAGDPGKTGNWDFASPKITRVFKLTNSFGQRPGTRYSSGTYANCRATRLEEIPNETIFSSKLHRGGACSLGNGCICDAARSRKRDGH